MKLANLIPLLKNSKTNEETSEIEKYRQDYGIQLFNPDDGLSICGIGYCHFQESLSEACRITGFSVDRRSGLYNSSKLKEYLLFEEDYRTRNQRFHEIMSVVSTQLAKEYDQDIEDLFYVLSILKDYLNMYYYTK